MNALEIESTQQIDVPEIQTWRLVLKAPAKTDVPAIVKLANNKTLAQNLGTMPVSVVYTFTKFIRREIKTGKVSSIGFVAKSAIDGIGTGIDSRPQR